MVTYPELRAVRPNQFADVAGMIRRLAESVAGRADDLSAAIDLLNSGWVGAAATAARNRLLTLHADLYAAYPGLIAIDQTLTEFAAALSDAQAAATAAAEPRPGSIVQVSPDGAVALVPTSGVPNDRDFADFDEVSAAIAGAVTAADQADVEAHRRLAAIALTVDRDQAPPSGPAAATNPLVVAAWWDGLSPAQQFYLIVMQPDVVAGLDGVPADARDQASRTLLHQQMATLTQQDRVLRSDPRTPAATAELAGIDASLGGLRTLDERVNDPYSVRAYLLDLDAPDNRAIVSISDPDRATNTLTFVPGSGSGLTTISSTLSAIDNIEEAGTHMPPSERWAPPGAVDLATIGWVDYDAPATLARAARVAPAEAAAPDLAAFGAGLRADNTRPDPYESVLGYSYGSVVTGFAAHQDGLDDDDIIFVGSPGTSVDHAADLGIDPSHVWATAARHDPIRLFGSWFGRSPIDPAYGARVFTSDPGALTRPGAAHAAYFDTDTASLANIAMIAIGDDADVY
jgi:uncharacterized protein YukE